MYSTKIRDVIPKQQLVIVNQQASVEDTLDLLQRHQISSAPIAEIVSGGTTESQVRVFGFVDVLDILSFLIDLTKPREVSPAPDEFEELRLKKEDIDSMLFRSKELRMDQVYPVANRSGRNMFNFMHADESVSAAIDHYLKGFHRIAVTDPQDRKHVVGVLAQSDVISYIHSTSDECCIQFPHLKERVADIPFKSAYVTKVNSNVTAIDAFVYMQKKKKSSLAVVDPNTGKLQFTLSASDLKYLRSKDFPMLLLPLNQFIPSIRRIQGKPVDYLVSCSVNSRMIDVIHVIHNEKIHRIFAVNEKFQPEFVISLTDILLGISQVQSQLGYMRPKSQ